MGRGRGRLRPADCARSAPAVRPGHVFAYRTRPLDPRTPCGSHDRSVFSHAAWDALGRIRVALPNCICDGLRHWRLDRGCRLGGSRDRGSVRSPDPISPARVATERCIDCGALRRFVDGAAYSGAAAYPRTASDGRMDCDADPRSRHASFSAVASAPAHDAMGESSRQLHIRSRNDRAHSVRRALARAAPGAIECGAPMGVLCPACLRCCLPEPLRPRSDPGDVPDDSVGRGIDDNHRMALAGFHPSRRISKS